MQEDRLECIYLGLGSGDSGSTHDSCGQRVVQLVFSTVYAFTQGETTPEEKLPSVEYHRYTGRPNLLRGVLTVLARNWSTPKVLYVQGAPNAWVALLLHFIFPFKATLFHTQDPVAPQNSRLMFWLERMLARRSSLVITNSTERAWLMAHAHSLYTRPLVHETRLPPLVCHPPAEAVRAMQKRYNPDGSLKLVIAGGPPSGQRRSEVLLAALRELNGRYRVVFTGAKCLPEEFAKQFKDVEKRVILAPRLGYSDLLALYAIGDVGVLNYSYNNAPNYFQAPGKISEYCMAGLPTIADNSPSLIKAVEAQGLGLTADGSSPTDVARAIMLLSNGREQYSQRCLEWSRDNVSKDGELAAALRQLL